MPPCCLERDLNFVTYKQSEIMQHFEILLILKHKIKS